MAPVIDSVYYRFQMFGSQPIRIKKNQDNTHLADLKSDQFTVLLLRKIWNVYKDYSALELAEMTHLPETPWRKARQGDLMKKFNVTINDELIRKYFVNRVKHDNTKTGITR